MNVSDVDTEMTVMGTLVAYPKALSRIGDAIEPEWFSDVLMRDLFAAFRNQTDNGREISYPLLLAELTKIGSEKLDGVQPKTIAASIAASATIPSAIPGLIHTIKDKWARRALIERAHEIQEVAKDASINPADYAADLAMSLDELADMDVEPTIGDLGDARTAFFDMLKDPNRMRGATSGLIDVDRKLGGFKKGFYYVVAGRPGSGKTAFVVSSLYKSACAGFGVYMVSLEMTNSQIFARLGSELVHRKFGGRAPQYEALLNAQATDQQLSAVLEQTETIKSKPFIYDTAPSLTMAQIRSRARTMKAELERQGKTLDVICVDHIGLVNARSSAYSGNKTAETGEVSNSLRAMAKELDCAVVAVSQLSRENTKRENKRPGLSDLRWAGEIEQDAHCVIFVHREAYYADETAMSAAEMMRIMRDMEIIISKNRNGSVGTVHVDIDIGFNRIDDAVHQSQQGEAA